MKEIGERLKEARESMGITTAEAAEDLKLEVSQIDNLEDGKMENFKDIYSLKYLIRDYSKYLGLDKEDLVKQSMSFCPAPDGGAIEIVDGE